MTPEEFSAYIASLTGPLQVACDTEFEGTLTLTSQFALRIGERIVVQVYKSPAIPAPVGGFEATQFRRLAERCGLPVELRPIKPITAALSPAEVVADLLELQDVSAFLDVGQAGNAQPYKIPLLLIAHHWPADFFRVFGSSYYSNLLLPTSPTQAPVCVGATKTLSFRRGRRGSQNFRPPVLGYLRCGSVVYSLETRYLDTSLPYGKGSLDSHARTFLGIEKSNAISRAEKAEMRRTFVERTNDAYEYAALDPVLTLLTAERMRAEERRMYAELGFSPEETPILRSTQGSRLVETMRRWIAKTCAAGSTELAAGKRGTRSGSVAGVSLAKVGRLMKKGAGAAVTTDSGSHFGRQNADSHGGLLFSRSPCKFFHDAPGKMRDVDLSGCYNSIIGTSKMYLGRPIVLEPGSRKMKLREAVALVEQHAAGRDAWIIKVSGPITQWPNALIPSTKNALTGANYLIDRKRRQARASRRLSFDEQARSTEDTGNSVIYTDVIEAGFVAWATWQVIKSLPEKIRQEYEALQVDTILFYHKSHVARTGPEFDALCERFSGETLPWRSELNPDTFVRTTEEKFDDEYVALAFDSGTLARRFGEFRARAQREQGKDSGAAFAWKQHGNTMYGVSASRHLETNNVVAANWITATGRALAFAMQMALNGIQVITDGCTYRLDQIPACTLSECLEASPEYPIRRIEEGIPFLPSDAIPQDDAGFTEWYRRHVGNFFRSSDVEFTELLAIHQLQHKQCGRPEQAPFDGLLCDGSGNYVKLLMVDGNWTCAEFKARSYKDEAKERLFPWLLSTYSNDRYECPPDLLEMKSLVSYKDAAQRSWKALCRLDEGRTAEQIAAAPSRIWLPVGLDARQLLAFKVIKPSAFLFRTPTQRTRLHKYLEKFAERFACGLELISLRRRLGGGARGSIVRVAEELYEYIRAGKTALGGDFNLSRSNETLNAIHTGHAARLAAGKEALQRRLVETIDAGRLPPHAELTGLLVDKRSIERIKQPLAT